MSFGFVFGGFVGFDFGVGGWVLDIFVDVIDDVG